MDHSRLQEFFSGASGLAQVCTQNGWPDPLTVSVEVLEENGTQVVCAVRFDEVIMEGSGCEAGRVACWGRFRLRLDARGEVAAAVLEAGDRKA